MRFEDNRSSLGVGMEMSKRGISAGDIESFAN
jgi:hypothetical protein